MLTCPGAGSALWNLKELRRIHSCAVISTLVRLLCVLILLKTDFFLQNWSSLPGWHSQIVYQKMLLDVKASHVWYLPYHPVSVIGLEIWDWCHIPNTLTGLDKGPGLFCPAVEPSQGEGYQKLLRVGAVGGILTTRGISAVWSRKFPFCYKCNNNLYVLGTCFC